MGKIYRYECRRLLWNQFFAGLAVVLFLYGALVLRGVTILGVSHTAPFSPWSFGDYLSRMLPLLWLGALTLLSFFTAPKARRAEVLTAAASMSPRRYTLARCLAALTGTVLLALLCVGQAALFYSWYFGWYAWGSLAFPMLVTLVPPLVFAMGSGWMLGRLRPWLLYAWMPVPFVCEMLLLPEAMGLWSGRFFAAYPLTLETLDPVFSVPISVLLVQCSLMAVGIGLLVFSPAKAMAKRG